MPETRFSPNGIYELTLPDGYVFEEHEEGISIYRETNAVGALTVCLYEVPARYAFHARKELTDFIASIDEDVTPSVKTEGKMAVTSFPLAGDFWKAWTWFEAPYGVFISYNCSAADQPRELRVVDGIVRSIRFLQQS